MVQKDDTFRLLDARTKSAELALIREEITRSVLLPIATTYGRLVYLSSLRDCNTGRYEHYLLGDAFDDSLAHEALESAHIEAFRCWLHMSLEQQQADLALYLTTLHSPKRHVLQTWLTTAPYRSLIPLRTQPVEQEVFLSDVQALLELLKNELAVLGPEGAA